MADRVALMVVHGMGEQRPLELTDTFVRGISRKLIGEQIAFRLRHVVEPLEGPLRSVQSYVRVEVEEPGEDGKVLGPNRFGSIEVHEVYWADRLTGIARLWAVIRWLATTSLTPVRFWSQQAAILAPRAENVWNRYWLLLRESGRALYIPGIGLGVLGLFTYSASQRRNLEAAGREVGELVDAVGNPWLTALMLLLVMAALGLFFGSFSLRRLRGAGTPRTSETPALRQWRQGSIVIGGLLVLSAVLIATLGDVAIIDPLHQAWLVVWNRGVLPALIALVVAFFFGRFLVKSIGDVMVYVDGVDEISELAKHRNEILSVTVDRLAQLLALTDSDQSDYRYDRVYVAAHSLGSVIAYDAINQLSVSKNALAQQLEIRFGEMDVEEKRLRLDEAFDRLHGFLSFGSPLDKIYYFFRRRIADEQMVRAQLVSSLTRFRKRRSGRTYEPYRLEPYEVAEPKPFAWWDVWSPLDPLGHRLDFYIVDEQRKLIFRRLNNHSGFWEDDRFYSIVTEWLTQPVFSEVGYRAEPQPTLSLDAHGFTAGRGVGVEITNEDGARTKVMVVANSSGAYEARVPLAQPLATGTHAVRLHDVETNAKTKARLIEVP